jgi:monovalent cation:H+ antiporter-2, CPA2 family
MGIAADFVLIVIAGLAGGILARLMRLPTLVGYVLAGVIVGPNTGGPTVTQVHDIELLAEIGVALLLFSLGLEISFGDLAPVKRIALVGGPIQVLLIAGLGAAGGHYLLSLPWTEALWCGAMLSLSSTMVVLKTLSAQGVTSTLASRVMIGLLVVQDLAVIPMMVVLPSLGATDNLLSTVLRSVAIAAAFLCAVYFVGTRLFPKLLEFVLRWGGRELFLVAVVATGVGVGYATHAVGISFALGAFIAGIILSESEFSHQALSDVVPLRDVFGLLFFVTVGMLFDPRYAIEHWKETLLILFVVFVVKAIVFGTLARAFGYVNMAPWIVGLGLSQVGEFSFVLARAGLAGNHLSKQTYDLALTVTILTMGLAPLVAGLALPLGRRWRSWSKQDQTVLSFDSAGPEACREIEGHIVVAGYGRTGKAIVSALREAALPFLVVESSYPVVADLRREGVDCFWGDVTRPEILEAAHIARAKCLALTMPDLPVIELALIEARRIAPSLPVVARASRVQHLAHLKSLGVTSAIQPEFEGGVSMVRATLRALDKDTAAIRPILERTRAALYRTVSH